MKKKNMHFKNILRFSVIVIVFYSCSPDRPDKPRESEVVAPSKTTPVINYVVKETYPHDIKLYTEGFLFHGDKLLESTGAPSHLPQTSSVFGVLDLETGKLDVKAELDKSIYFGEGIVVLNDKIYQLTYQNQVGFIYDAKTFKKAGQFNYRNKEGWGLTTEGKHLIMSDGTYNLTFIDPSNFNVVKTLPVLKDGYGLDNINELEYINGFIYANVWMTHLIVKIDPATGEVVSQLDLTALFDKSLKSNVNLAEMNGIAYDPIKDRILVTGKLWPYVFEIEFPH